jgi:hypothetical protein
MQTIHEFDFVPLNFDKSGALAPDGQFESLKQRAASATDVIFLAHGFRNNAVDATTLYTKFLDNFRSHFSRPEFQNLAARNFVVVGIFWPSKALPESFPANTGSVQSLDPDAPLTAALTQKLQSLQDDSPEHAAQLNQAIGLLSQVKDDASAQDRFSALVLSVCDGSELDPTEGLPQIRQQQGSVLFEKLTTPIILPTETSTEGGVTAFQDDGGGVQSIGSFFGSILGGIDTFLNLTTWYVMKNRSGIVGATGVAKAVRDLKASDTNVKIHLVGHSLGGRLMASCCKSLAQTPLLQPDSLMLLEAAFSHYGFSDNNGKGTPGFFRDVIEKKVVKGPLLETFSMQDTVVGLDYSISSRLADDNVKAIGDATDEFGGIGRNGSQKTKESVFMKLKNADSPGDPYTFQPGIVTNLDGSGGLITGHGDITNEDVTYAFASLLTSNTSLGASVSLK